MSNYQDFSSWRPDQERHFIVFEQQSHESLKKAKVTGLGVAIGTFILIVIVVMSFEKPKGIDADVKHDELGAERAAAPAPAPTPAPEPAAAPPAEPAADPAAAGAEAAAGGEAAPSEAAPSEAAPSEAPPPPKGATKAPPTSLIKKK